MKSIKTIGGVLLLLATVLVPLKPAAAEEIVLNAAPVFFDFKPQDVPNYDAVVVTVTGMNMDDAKKAVIDRILKRLTVGRDAAAVEAEDLTFGDPGYSAQPNSYLEDSLNGMLARAGKHYLVVPLRWTRNPDHTAEAEAQIQGWLSQVYAVAQANHKPVYAFSHSWGTVIIRHVLASLAAQGSPVRIEKMITVGSPLVPSNWIIREFSRMELPAQDFGEQVSKPANVGLWTNFWAKRDVVSHEIPAADVNYRVDGGADRDQALLEDARWDLRHTIGAEKDLKVLKNHGAWHSSYFIGFHRFFRTINSQLDLDIPASDVMPNAF